MTGERSRGGRAWRLSWALAFVFAAALLPAAARGDSTWVQHYRAARAAHLAGDLAGFREQLRVVRDSIGEHPTIHYNLACAAARLGERDEALRRLQFFAASGLVQDAAADSVFVSLWGDSEFRALAARIRANGDSVGAATERHRFRDAALLTEDLAYDSKSRSFFVSSIHRGRVIEVTAQKTEKVWIDPAAQPGWGVFALAVDAPRHLLWTSVAATPTTSGYVAADSGRTGLVAWDLRTRKPVRRLEWPADGSARLFGDLTVGPDGTVYVTDSPGGAVRFVRPGSESIETLAGDHVFQSPQTPALSADGRRLYVADYPRGIGILDLRSGERSWVSFEPGIALHGIDGLYLTGSDLIAVQNGTNPARVMRFRLDAAGTRVMSGTPIESGTVRLGQPTHATLVGRRLYFLANTGWDRVGRDERMSDATAVPAAIFETELP